MSPNFILLWPESLSIYYIILHMYMYIQNISLTQTIAIKLILFHSFSLCGLPSTKHSAEHNKAVICDE